MIKLRQMEVFLTEVIQTATIYDLFFIFLSCVTVLKVDQLFIFFLFAFGNELMDVII